MAKKKEEFSNEPKVEITEEIKTSNYECFNLVTRNGKTQVCIQNYILSKKEFESEEAAKSYIDSKPWELIVNASCCLMEISTKK